MVVVPTEAEAIDYLFRRESHAQRLPGNPAVILLSLDTRRKNDFQLLQTIRTDPELGSIPVVILSSSYDKSPVAQAYRLGANGYIVKPKDPAEFVQAIHDLCMFWGVFNVPPPARRQSTLNTAAG